MQSLIPKLLVFALMGAGWSENLQAASPSEPKSVMITRDAKPEPIAIDHLSGTNHEASLLNAEVLLGWVSDSKQFIKAFPVKTAKAAR